MSRRPAALLAVLALALPVLAAAEGDAPAKREEGRYFLNLAEIFVETSDFDLALGEKDPGGPGDTVPPVAISAELPRLQMETPRLTFGLNRPSGKTTYSIRLQSVDLNDSRIPPNFDDDSNVITSYLLPNGVVFRRLERVPDDLVNISPDFVPNWATEYAYTRRASFRTADFLAEHNLYENKVTRLRWVGGLRYGQLQQKLSQGLAFAKEYEYPRDEDGVPVTGRTLEAQDFYLMQSTIDTNGIGPELGLALRLLPGSKKKWSVDGNATMSYLPETTTAHVSMSFSDAPSVAHISFNSDTGEYRIEITPASPILPGLGLRPDSYPFDGKVEQTDFREGVWVAEGRLGFAYKANSFFSIGMELWHMRWMNVLSQTGALHDALTQATYAVYPGNVFAGDPQLRDEDTVIRVPRFSKREDYDFSGIGISLNFEF